MSTQKRYGLKQYGLKQYGWLSALAVVAVSVLLVGIPAGADKKEKEKGKGTVVGQVTDPQGFPIEGAAVSVEKGPSAATDPGGMYTLTGVKQEERVVVSFKKAGYASTQGIAILKIECEGEKEEHGKHHQECEEVKLDRVTLNKVMVPAGASQTVDAAAGGTLTQGGFKVTFAPGSLNATGSVDVVISPIDVSTSEIFAFPGDFTGIAVGGGGVLLETFSLMDVSITQNGLPVNLKKGTTASVEFLLPATTSLTLGQTIPLWFFDEKKGKWKEEGTGTVGVSTTDPTRLAVFGQVKHFTWWNVDNPISTQTCLTGFVYDQNGNPVAGAYVYANGVDYFGVSYGVTDATGRYCVNVRRASVVTLTVNYVISGVTFTSTSAPVSTSDVQMTCATGGCASVPNLVIAAELSCVQGDVRDAADNPVVGVTVSSTAGGYATTDANGAFCLPAPANTSVTVFTSGYPAVTVTTPPAGASCAIGGCAIAQIRPPAAGTGACLRVTVVDDVGSPLPNAYVDVYEISNWNLLYSGQADANGVVCIEGLPAGIDVRVRSGECGLADVNTGPAGTSCAAGTCVPVVVTECVGLPV